MNLQVIENIDLHQFLQAVREADRERSNIALQNKKSRVQCANTTWSKVRKIPNNCFYPRVRADVKGGRQCKCIACSSVLHPSSGFDSRPERESVDHRNSLSQRGKPLRKGLGATEIARQMQIARSTVYNILKPLSDMRLQA